MRRHARGAVAAAVVVLFLAWGARLVPQAAPVARNAAVVLGISRYDASTKLFDLPQCEAAAADLAKRLRGLDGYEARNVALHQGRLARSDVMEMIRSAGKDAATEGRFVVALHCAGDAEGLFASNGRLSDRDLRDAIASSPARDLVVLVDAGGSRERSLLIEGRRMAVLSSSSAEQAAWPLLLPNRRGAVRLVSAASAGWARAMERRGSSWRGDMGQKRRLSLEDLLLSSEFTAGAAVPDMDGGFPLDGDVARDVLRHAWRELGDRLARGESMPLGDVRDHFAKRVYAQFCGIVWTLGDDDFRRRGAVEKRRLLDAVADRRGARFVRAYHAKLVREGLLVSPDSGEEEHWKRIEPSAGQRVLLVRPAREQPAIAGDKDLAVSGSAGRCAYEPAYGYYQGRLRDESKVRVRMRIFGTWVSGRWEGSYQDKWLRGDWLGRYDPRDGQVHGSIVGRLGANSPRSGRQDKEQPMIAVFEGRVRDEGRALDGSWKVGGRFPGPHGRWRVAR